MTGRAGYSLLEVLVAFAVMSMVLAVLIPGQARLFRRADEAGEILLAHDLAASRIARLGLELPLDPGSNESEWREWRIVEETVDLDPVEGQMPVRLIRVEVFSATGASLARVESLRAMQ